MASKTKFIFVSGGVISALGKGITSASISFLLKRQGFKVHPIKCENYLNIDSGTINPIEHGDPFLCFDGLEGDQDLGNYERFLEQPVGYKNFMTMGQLYSTVIQNERDMVYNGEDVEPIPHIVDEIIRRITSSSKEANADFCVIELGGTIGEYENNNGLYYEAARVMAFNHPVAHVHVTYIPVPPHVGEPKTKPAQMGLKELMSKGISPNFIVCRSEIPIDDKRKYKFALKFNIKKEDIFSAENLSDIHEVPLHLHNQKLDERIFKYFKIKAKQTPELKDWQRFVEKVKLDKSIEVISKKKPVIAIVGKYFGTGNSQLKDSYLALLNSIHHASIKTDISVDTLYINSEEQEKKLPELLKNVDGIIVPIGWGSRGVEGKIKAIQIAREQKIPYLGLCYGMQLACIEYARNVLNLKDATTEENDRNAKHKIIHSIPFDAIYQTIKGKGTSMRLGTFDCMIKPHTLAKEVYTKYKSNEMHTWQDITEGETSLSRTLEVGKKSENEQTLVRANQLQKGTIVVQERHRHRFEFNNAYREQFEKAGFVFSGTSPDDFFVEMIELPKKIHPFFLATQAHPEYKSYPLHPHPMFMEFIKATSEFGK